MYVDDWGNEYKTLNEAKKGIRKICLSQDKEEIYELISDYMTIPLEVVRWIGENHYIAIDFSITFMNEIDKAIDDWCESYIEDLEYYDD